eukprot:CAMPEP_0202780346 /NCGR_PEP_ID=MMETSP1388-20130828/58495_1 /ASSEMBLY_ACC=CAM_ASM_000864 /TAXON_ID=37098 /ORGANISM="Isochrysis sp, Strain CCMP1244" /LENGTH=49 /DNA_ID= /DNA_START= /DNA_END= /DNA_ORIENTATION=
MEASRLHAAVKFQVGASACQSAARDTGGDFGALSTLPPHPFTLNNTGEE